MSIFPAGHHLVFVTIPCIVVLGLFMLWLLQDNDYGETYFDNGEDYGADSGDDLEDGATYGY